ncbi:monooxygenase [Marinobacterium sediminicola]|uniref:Mono-oxygenase ydhR n=1 Tax=Marinobacterium sediminicola TaxID=518898 RepID=A0ABY1RYM1_9GAMM|nr:monooxygenase [Marinobacterium sediminicola]ULG68076.1 monooxygenase [Marinobacterium sediminicola]SMR73412.1 Putative mono-oxygenase ydhR [Marinobacterium sediminicola]
MAVILQIDFTMPAEMLGENLTNAARELAESINQEPGFISKIWTENAATGEAGGIYHFTDRASAQAYLEMHSKRVEAMGAEQIRSRIFDINETLTAINAGQTGKGQPGH